MPVNRLLSSKILFRLIFLGLFRRRLSPTIEIGLLEPPTGIFPFNTLQITLLMSLSSAGPTVGYSEETFH